MTAPLAQSAAVVRRQTALVFFALCCLYVLSGGGQGYSVDGTFSYELARHFALEPDIPLSRDERDVLKRWGPVTPLLGAPLVKLGERMAHAAPWRDSLPLDGQQVRLYDWPSIGPGDGTAPQPQLELSVPVQARQASRLRVVSFLSFGAGLPDQSPVSTIVVSDHQANVVRTVTLRAGVDTAEWAYNVPGAQTPQHRRAPVAGHWPGNPEGNLYVATFDLPAQDVAELAVRYTAATGRLHVRAVVLDTPGSAVQAPGPPGWTENQQERLFSRLGFSFVNAPLMALTCALLVVVAVRLGYPVASGTLLALGVGTTTLAWPYAKLDFSETAASAFAATGLALVIAGTRGGGRLRLIWLALGGLAAVAAASAKYTAAVFVLLLAAQVAILAHRRSARHALTATGAFLLVPALGGLAMLGSRAGGPNVLDWRGALTRGWLDFDPWQGLYGLLLSPGKSLFLYAPPLLLAGVATLAFVRRHRAEALVFVVTPLCYLAMFAGKGVWSGGGWGPRYLVPALPFAACLALPVVERIRTQPGRWRSLAVILGVAGLVAQLLGVAKHPNLYTIMFRDHILPALPDYGAPLGGPPALAYWRHFGGPQAGRQLDRPVSDTRPEDLPRGLGYAFADDGPLTLHVDGTPAAAPYALSLYACDWDHRGRRQRITIQEVSGTQTYEENYDFSGCEYLTWPSVGPGPVNVVVEATGPESPVLSGLFFDPSSGGDGVQRDTQTAGHWAERYGRDGHVLLAWRRGSQDLTSPPSYVASVGGGHRVWIDTGEADLEDTALLYAPAFSPLPAHAWLLAGDLVRDAAPRNVALLARVLGSPPWRYLAGLEIHPAHPEYGLGLDFWPLLLRAQFSSYGRFMGLVWTVEAMLAAVSVTTAWLALRGAPWRDAAVRATR